VVTTSGAAIAGAALRYKGESYVYGGTGAQPGDWDCSSFVSYVLGHDLGLQVPGGTWAQVTASGTQHGPVVTSYATWSGAATIPASAAAEGDLVLFVGLGTGGHMGIVLGPDKMISALDPLIRGVADSGTAETPINGFGPPGAPIVYRRLRDAAAGPIPQGAAGSGWGALLIAAAAGLGIGAAMIAAILALAIGAAAAAVWLAGRAAKEAG
jgi:cell wall-associated NlpC family hydrolase